MVTTDPPANPHLGHTVIRLETTTSTNDVARALAQRGASDGTLVIAEQQTSGRGRRGRVWQSSPGDCLLISLILRPPLSPGQAARLTMLAAIAVARAVRACGASAVIKWPNDVLINGRKVAGILTETDIQAEFLRYAVVGIGVNVNVASEDLPALAERATSLLDATGRVIEVAHVLHLLLAEMESRYVAMGQDGVQAVFEEWRALLETSGRVVQVQTPDETISGYAEGVDASGALLVRRDSGEIVPVTFGDVM